MSATPAKKRHSKSPHGSRRGRLERLEPRLLLSFDPSGVEQEVLFDMNRMRALPQAERDVLFSSISPLVARDSQTNLGVQYYKDPTSQEIQTDWPLLQAVPPLAWNAPLYNAATAHSQLMIADDTQSHQLPGEAAFWDRDEAAGYTNWTDIGENCDAYGSSGFNIHSTLAIDFGNGWDNYGHRTNMMSADFREAGVAVVPDTRSGVQLGPLVVTEDFGNRSTIGNPFLLGVVYNDANQDGQYDAGEGIAGATVTVSGTAGTFTATTMSAGGYQVQVPAGTYAVAVSGGSLASPASMPVTIGSDNVEADFVSGLDSGYVNFRLWVKSSPVFSALAHPTITAGTATTTLSGSISLVPDGQTVSITLGGVTQTATVNGGAFSSDFATAALTTGGSPYTITYAYAGDANLHAASDATQTLTVVSAAATVIDDGDFGFTTTGAWSPTAGQGCQDDIRWAARGPGDSVAAWTFDVAPGQYQVAVTWTTAANRATNAQYTISDGAAAVGVIEANQRVAPQGFTDGGVIWEALGLFNVSSHTLVVTLSNKANKYVIADAVRIVRTGDVGPSPLQIIDSGDAGYTATAGWSSVGGDGYLNDLDYCYKAGSSAAADAAAWTFTVAPGQYRVSTTWSPYKNRATNAPYTILDGAASLGTVKINQQLSPADFTEHGVAWENLGVFNVSGSTLVVTLSNQANKYVIADAVRIERLGPLSALPLQAIVDNGDAAFGLKGIWDYWAQGCLGSVFGSAPASDVNVARWAFDVTPGAYEIWTTWTPYKNRATDAPYTIYDGSTDVGSTTVDQTQTPSGFSEHGTTWQLLGTFVVSGSSLVVRLSNQANGYVIADAVRIEQVLPQKAVLVDAAFATF